MSSKYEVPPWLIERLVEARAKNGKGYLVSVRQGFMEVPDWAYHLRSADGKSLLEHPMDLQKFFDSVFEATQRGESFGLRLVSGARTEHFMMLTGTLAQSMIEGLGLSQPYEWKPNPDA